MSDDFLPGMGAMVLPCWICGALAQQVVHTKEGLKEFHRYGPLCDNHLKWAREQEKEEKEGK